MWNVAAEKSLPTELEWKFPFRGTPSLYPWECIEDFIPKGRDLKRFRVDVEFRTLQGNIAGCASVCAAALGRELIEQARLTVDSQARIISLFHNRVRIQEMVPVGEQDLHNAVLQLVVSSVTQKQQKRVRSQVIGGMEPGDNWQVWDGLDVITLEKVPRHVLSPCCLRKLTFASKFNKSLTNVVIPSGLQTLIFENEFQEGAFNKSLDNVTLPNALQELVLGGNFNQSLDNTSLPSGLQGLFPSDNSTRV